VVPLDRWWSASSCRRGSAAPGPQAASSAARHGAPFVRLRELFGVPGAAPPRRAWWWSATETRCRAGVDGLLGESQVVIKPLGHLFRALPGVSGCTIFGSGRIALILDVRAIFAAATGRGALASQPS